MFLYAKECQGLPANHQKLGEKPGTASPLHPSEGTSPEDTFVQTSSFQNFETTNFYCLSHIVSGFLLGQPQQTEGFWDSHWSQTISLLPHIGIWSWEQRSLPWSFLLTENLRESSLHLQADNNQRLSQWDQILQRNLFCSPPGSHGKDAS